MNSTLTRVMVAAAAGIVLAAPVLAGAGAAGATGTVSGTARSAGTPRITLLTDPPGAELWVARHRAGDARSVAVSPDGTRVYVTGTGYGMYDRTPYTTAAYDATTGGRLWIKSYGNGYGGQAAEAQAVAVSPDGKTVFVTGSNPAFDYPSAVTVAYNAATGARLWIAKYYGLTVGGATAAGLAVSPDGSRVFVSGTHYTGAYRETDSDYLTLAYNAATGKQAWVSLYNGTLNGPDHASAVVLNPTGSTVFVTGASGTDYLTVGYSASTGTRLWATRYNGPGNGGDSPSAIAANPAGSRVFVTGHSRGATSRSDYATIAYSTSTGARLWVSRYNGPSGGNDDATSIAVSPGGGRTVFVTGSSYGGTASKSDYATVAYNSLTGARMWVKRYDGPAGGADDATSLAVRPGAGTVYVTGSSYGGPARADYATLAYQGSTGTRLWVTRYNGPHNGNDRASAIAVLGGTVFVTGTSEPPDYSRSYYATVAYTG